jgi:hypothetical protein
VCNASSVLQKDIHLGRLRKKPRYNMKEFQGQSLKLRPSDCRAERKGSAPFTVIILKLKERFGDIDRHVKFKALKNFPLKEPHITRKPYTSISI